MAGKTLIIGAVAALILLGGFAVAGCHGPMRHGCGMGYYDHSTRSTSVQYAPSSENVSSPSASAVAVRSCGHWYRWLPWHNSARCSWSRGHGRQWGCGCCG